jgi:DNA (cytosine-5)-methyltransferase 1
MPDEKPIMLSFFSGAMGLDIGLEKAGFKIKLACEIDPYCQRTIRKNHPDIPLIEDVRDYDAKDIREISGVGDSDIDLVVGGPPCQAFSTAGKRRGLNDKRGHVFLDFIQLCISLNPKYIVIENVRGLLSAPMEHRPHKWRGDGFSPLSEDERRGGALKFVLSIINEAGYSASFNLYDAANFGVPQRRERVIIICSRDEDPSPHIPPTHCGDAYEQLPKYSNLKPWSTFREAVTGLEQHTHTNFPDSRVEYYKMLGPGENWRQLPEEMQRKAMGKAFDSGGGRTGFYRRIAWDKPSPTVVTSPAQKATDLAHPVETRPLSIEEYARVQMFPDDWEFDGPIMEVYKQIGNAVPVGLGQALGEHLINLIEGREIPSFEDYRYSRYKNTSERTQVKIMAT